MSTYSKSLSIQDWLQQIKSTPTAPRKRPHQDINPDGMVSPARSTSPSKPRCIDKKSWDGVGGTKTAERAADDNYSGARTPTPSLSSASQSVRSDLPIERGTVQDLTDSRLIELVRRIAQCKDKEGILPKALEQQLQSGETISDRIRPWMFTDDIRDRTYQDYEYQRIRHICRNSSKCGDAAHPVHEVEWNERVHSPMLELAFEQQEESMTEEWKALVYHNITNVRIDQQFRDADLFLKENKVDYGVFLAPSNHSTLGQGIASRCRHARRNGYTDQVHALESFEPDRPLAIGIETKRHRGGHGHAPSQLANWARTNFKAVSCFLGQKGHVGGGTAPPCPLIEIEGTIWHASFAVREGNAVTIYTGVQLGSTESLTDCYALLRSLECLADWARNACWDWWQLQLQADE